MNEENMKAKNKSKKIFIIISILILIVIISIALILRFLNKKEENAQQPLITKVGDISLEIKAAYDFTNGLAVIKYDGKEYIIDQTGKLLSDGYETIYEYDNYYSMCNKDGCTLGNNKGKKLFDLKPYNDIYVSHNFFIAEKIDDDESTRYALIDKNGELLTKFDYSDFTSSKEYVFFLNDDNEYEAVNKEGETKNIYDYDQIYSESEESKSFIVTKNEKFAIADANGKLLTDYDYDNITLLDKKGPYLAVSNEKYGLVDIDGKAIVDVNYDYIFNYADGYISVCNVKNNGENADDYNCGVMDKNGNKIINLKYNYSYVFDDNHIIVGEANDDKIVYGLLDKNGKKLLDLKYDYVYFTEDNHFVTIMDNKFSVYDNDLKKLFGDVEGNVIYYNNGYFTLEKDRKYGFVDLHGNFVGKGIVYDEAGTFNDGLVPVEVGRYWGYINIEGKTIIGNIDEKFKDEEESEEKVKVNIFYGNGCPHCAELEEWIESDEIQEKYGGIFEINYYEVWYNASNKALVQDIANYLEKPFTGVPYIVIGDVVYSGFASGMEDRILQTIKDEHNKKPSERIDVIAEIKGEN